jgi:hypothetical protein
VDYQQLNRVASDSNAQGAASPPRL